MCSPGTGTGDVRFALWGWLGDARSKGRLGSPEAAELASTTEASAELPAPGGAVRSRPDMAIPKPMTVATMNNPIGIARLTGLG